MKLFLGLGLVLLAAQAYAAPEKTDAQTAATAKYNADATALKKIVTGKKVLVVYYSKTGNTERVAKDIAGTLGADIEKLTDLKNRSGFFAWFGSGSDAMHKKTTEIGPLKYDAAKYDIIIIGSPVWGWNMTPAVRTYIEMNKVKLKDVAFFVTAGGTPAENVVPSMEEASGKKALAYVGFVTKELKNKDAYWAKLTKFLATFGKGKD